MKVVVLTLRAPLSSWSEGGVTYRPTDMVPTWSALVGLIGAAFGWARDDNRLVELAREYAPAVKVEKNGERIVDYHTVQTPHAPSLGNIAPLTRLDELERGRKVDGMVHTNITRREYVCDAAYAVAIFPTGPTPTPAAGEIVEALRNPVFPLYLGRKSCTPTHIEATVIEAAKVEDALDATHWDARLTTKLSATAARERRDQLLSVSPRSFGLRRECVR